MRMNIDMLKATEINTLEDGFGITRGLRLKCSCKSMSWKMTLFKKKNSSISIVFR
jgi:hypothetical protein